jgi:hypothetical protein
MMMRHGEMASPPAKPLTPTVSHDSDAKRGFSP